jgi:hypothetical protein
MWNCPNCGEPIDDVFDACWKCGTNRDGTRAADFAVEPSDPQTPDPRAEPDPPDESLAAANDPKNQRIVELCSAANAVEANAIRSLLEEEGIQTCVVGDSLGNAAGGLPLGETTAPRIWVREKDAARAREVIDEQIAEPFQEESSPAGDDEAGTPEAASPPEDALPDDAPSEDAPGDDTPPDSDVRSQGRGRGWLTVGLACLVLGTLLAWHDWMSWHKYSAMAEGVAVQYRRHYSIDSHPTSEIPIPRVTSTTSPWYEIQYAFVVNGKTYYSVDPHCQRLVRRVPIHYDPHDPASNLRGSLTSPWPVLAFTLIVGGFLVLIGYNSARAVAGPAARG